MLFSYKYYVNPYNKRYSIRNCKYKFIYHSSKTSQSTISRKFDLRFLFLPNSSQWERKHGSNIKLTEQI